MPKVMSLYLELLLEGTPCRSSPLVTIVTIMVNARASPIALLSIRPWKRDIPG